MRRLRNGFHVHCGRAAVLPRKRFQKRAKAVQVLQEQAPKRLVRTQRTARACRDLGDLLSMRTRNHRPLPAHPGTPGVLPDVFPGPQSRGSRSQRLKIRGNGFGKRLNSRLRRSGSDTFAIANVYPVVSGSRELLSSNGLNQIVPLHTINGSQRSCARKTAP
jgi:hypothetical protein